MTGLRLLIGVIVMGVIVPIVLFLLLNLQTLAQLFVIAATTFLAWSVAEVLAAILARPRLSDRTPGRALREDWERRGK